MLFAAVEAAGVSKAELYPTARLVFLVATNLIGLWIAVGAPLRAGYREKPVLNAVLKGWVGSILYMIALCFLAPWVGSMLSAELGKEMFRSWVPEGPAIVGIALIGWLLPLIAASIGALVGAARERLK